MIYMFVDLDRILCNYLGEKIFKAIYRKNILSIVNVINCLVSLELFLNVYKHYNKMK